MRSAANRFAAGLAEGEEHAIKLDDTVDGTEVASDRAVDAMRNVPRACLGIQQRQREPLVRPRPDGATLVPRQSPPPRLSQADGSIEPSRRRGAVRCP